MVLVVVRVIFDFRLKILVGDGLIQCSKFETPTHRSTLRRAKVILGAFLSPDRAELNTRIW